MEDTRNMTQGKRILYYRKRVGLTQDQLAEKMGVSPQAVSKWERDLSCPDITTLPRLAEIFGITTDELLGVQPPEPEERPQPEEPRKEKPRIAWDFSLEVPKGKWHGLAAGLSLLALGGLYLASRILHWDVDIWDLLWPIAIVYLGLLSVRNPGGFVFGSGAILAGLYFLLGNLDLFSMKVTWPIVLGVLLVLWGLKLIVSLFRKPKVLIVKKPTDPDAIRRGKEKPTRRYQESEGAIHADYAFCSDRVQVNKEVFRGGQVEVAFGSLVLDLQKCGSVAPDCVLEVDVAFGSLVMILPDNIRVEVMGERAGTALDVTGSPREDAEILRLDGDFAFSSVKIKYIET